MTKLGIRREAVRGPTDALIIAHAHGFSGTPNRRFITEQRAGADLRSSGLDVRSPELTKARLAFVLAGADDVGKLATSKGRLNGALRKT